MFVYEFHRIMPEGYMLLNTTGTIRRLVDDHLERQLQRVEEATLDLVEAGADFIIVGGSPIFTRLGPGSDRDVAARLEAKAGVPVAAGMTCEVESLRHMGIEKVAVATPYPQPLTDRVCEFLEASGFEIAAAAGLGIEQNSELSNQPAAAAYDIARRVYDSNPRANGVFLPCNRWPTLPSVPKIEEYTGKPALSSTLCNIWYALHRLGIKETLPGRAGTLLSTLSP